MKNHLSTSLLRAALAALLLLGTAACSGKKQPDPIPSQTTTQSTSRLEAPPNLPPPIRQVRPTRPTTVKVIDPGGNDEGPQTLIEASQLAKTRQRGEPSREPVVEINDENLHEYAGKAEVIMIEGEPAAPALTLARAPEGTEGTSSDLDTGTDAVRDEQYWRNGALDLRMGWRRTLDRIDELELESAALRQQFYAEEDTYIRDNHVKPEWDRVLDRLGQLRDRAQRYNQELDQFVEDGRRAGAHPGWLSEGWELEPEPGETGQEEELDPFSAHQSGEPQVVDEVIDP